MKRFHGIQIPALTEQCPGLAFFIFIRREVLTKWLSFELFLVLILLTNANFNTQVFWFVITSLALKKWYTMPQ